MLLFAEACLSSEDSVCHQCQRQRMTDDQKSMATQADFDQPEDGTHLYASQSEDDLYPDGTQSCDQSGDELAGQSEEEFLDSPPPIRAHNTSAFSSPPLSPDGDTSSGDLTFDPTSEGDSHEFCPNCLQNMNSRRMSPPQLSPDGDMKQLYVEAKLKIYQATKELREGRPKGNNTNFQRGNTLTRSSASKSKVNVRESVRKLLKRKKSRERDHSLSFADSP